jgi:hypothetical protein
VGLLDSVVLPASGAALRPALVAADAVLPGAGIAPLPVVVAEEPGYRWEGGRGLWIAISPQSEHAGLALLHELGHAVDHQLLGWGSERARLDSWWLAVTRTRAFRSLRRACSSEQLAYWPTRRESFARAFAQWVAERAGEPDALREIERRAGGAGRQWARDDFAPVADELDAVLAPMAAAA